MCIVRAPISCGTNRLPPSPDRIFVCLLLLPFPASLSTLSFFEQSFVHAGTAILPPTFKTGSTQDGIRYRGGFGVNCSLASHHLIAADMVATRVGTVAAGEGTVVAVGVGEGTLAEVEVRVQHGALVGAVGHSADIPNLGRGKGAKRSKRRKKRKLCTLCLFCRIVAQY